MSSNCGKLLKVQLFGESHGEAVGAVIDGFPAGFPVDMEKLQNFLNRRAARLQIHTPRRETDVPRVLSGVYRGHTTGTPLAVLFENQAARPSDYEALADIPRPGHGDWPAMAHGFGFEDLRGGGHHSGRLTLPYCFAGGLALQWLAARGVRVGAHLLSVGNIQDEGLDPMAPDFACLAACHARPIPMLKESAAGAAFAALEEISSAGDSLGAVVECAADGLPAGVGEPYFDNMESLLSAQLFAIPGVKGVSFGEGFAAAGMKGSEYNDPYTLRDGNITPKSNHAGGLLGGMTDGAPILLQAAFRPTASIRKEQITARLDGGECTLSIQGRHDPCVALRAVPVVESAVALVLMDALLERMARTGNEGKL